jgi:hypothetical protein
MKDVFIQKEGSYEMKKAATLLVAVGMTVTLFSACSADKHTPVKSTVTIKTDGTISSTTTTEETTVLQTTTTSAATSTTEKATASTAKTTVKRTATTTKKKTTTKATTTTKKPATNNAGKIVNGIYTSADKSWQIKVPSGWTLEDPELVVFADKNGNSIMFEEADPEPGIASYDWSHFESIISEEEGESGITVKSDVFEHLTIDGRPSIFMNYTISMEALGMELKLYQCMIGATDHCYNFALMSDDYSSNLINSFKTCVKSFKLL